MPPVGRTRFRSNVFRFTIRVTDDLDAFSEKELSIPIS
jgi:hypothetical protein